MQRGIDLAKAQKSDLFVFTGDLVNNAAWEIEPYLERFSQLKAPYGQFSILGNHDYGDYIHWDSEHEKAANLKKLKQHHKTLGYHLLLDENVEIEKNGQKITLMSVQNWGRGFIQLGNLKKALEGVDTKAFKILLSHDPTHWEEQVRHNPANIHLTLAGHTHGALRRGGSGFQMESREVSLPGLGRPGERKKPLPVCKPRIWFFSFFRTPGDMARGYSAHPKKSKV